jgi:hypothetical protein
MSTTRSQLYRFARDLGNVEAVELGYKRGGLSGGAEGAMDGRLGGSSTARAIVRSTGLFALSASDRDDADPSTSPFITPNTTATAVLDDDGNAVFLFEGTSSVAGPRWLPPTWRQVPTRPTPPSTSCRPSRPSDPPWSVPCPARHLARGVSTLSIGSPHSPSMCARTAGNGDHPGRIRETPRSGPRENGE